MHSHTQISEMYAERKHLLAESNRILERSKGGARVITGAEMEQVDRLQNAAADLYNRALEAERDNQVSRRDGGGHTGGPLAGIHGGPLTYPTTRAVPVESAARDARREIGSFRGQQATVEGDSPELDRTTASYEAAFSAYLQGRPSAGMQTDIEQKGGYLAPPQFVVGLVKALDSGTWFRSLANVRPPSAASSVIQGRRTSRVGSVAWSQELAVPNTEDSLKFGTHVLTPHYMTGEIEVSTGLANSPGVELVLAGELNAAAASLEEAAFVSGDGIRKPMGLFTPSDQGIPASRDIAGSETTIDTYADAKYSLSAPYLRSPSLRWVFHPNAVRTLSKLKSTANEPIWRLAERPGERDMFLGVAVEVSDDAPKGSGDQNAWQAGDYVGIIGDLKEYDIQDNLDLSITRHDDSIYLRRGSVLYIFRRKVDGCPRIAEAFARVKKS